MKHKKLELGISACLAGENVRFDGGHRKDKSLIAELGKCFEFRTYCPELAIGMGVPRETIQLRKTSSGIQAIGNRSQNLNVTRALHDNATQQQTWIEKLSGFIVKKGSPSCGMERVKVYSEKRVEPVGHGIFTERLMQLNPLLPVEEEGRLKNPLLLDSFIQRVYAYSKWKKLTQDSITAHQLIQFHSGYKMILLARNQKNYRQLGRMVGRVCSKNIEVTVSEYIELFMETLKQPATRPGNVNVLQHLQGFLKNKLSAADKQQLIFMVDRYRDGELPLIAPKVLLNMHFQKHKYRFIEDSLYLKPYPVELGIYNKL